MSSVGNISFCRYRVYLKGATNEGKSCAYPTPIIRNTLTEAQSEIKAIREMQVRRNEKPLEYQAFNQKTAMATILRIMHVETIGKIR